MWPFNIKLNPNTALRRTIDGRASFYNARLFFVVLGVQNWVPIEHGHIYRIIYTSENTTQRNVKTTHRTWQRKLFERKFVCFVVCFVLFCFFFFCFFFGGGGREFGLGLFVFLGGGAGIHATATLTQSIALRSAIVGRENLIAGGLFVLLFWFLFYFYYFFGGRLVELFWGWWTGYRLSRLCSEHWITKNFSAIWFSVCFAFCCGLVCLFLFNPCSTSEHQKI